MAQKTNSSLDLSPNDISPNDLSPNDLSPRLLEYKRVNWRGLWTLYQREVRRFLIVWVQTVATPAITALILLAIFSLAFGRAELHIAGMPFSTFIMPGLVMMSVIQNAFANTSSSILASKMQGNIADLLLAPLNAAELTFALVAGGATRGFGVGILVTLALLPFVEIQFVHPAYIIYNALCAAVLMASLGAFVGLWAEKFEHGAALTSFVVVPLSFLSGTFYQIKDLPEPFQTISRLDPLFYLVDGLRYGFTGLAESNPLKSAIALFFITAATYFAIWLLFKKGYKIRG